MSTRSADSTGFASQADAQAPDIVAEFWDFLRNKKNKERERSVVISRGCHRSAP